MRTIVAIMIFLLAACATTGPAVDKTKMAEGYYKKGLSYFENKNYQLASVEFERSIQSDSDYRDSYYGLGLVNDYMGKLDDAAKYYEKAIDLDADFSEAHNAVGVIYFKQQKWKEAVKAFKKALQNKLYTTPYLPYLNLGDLYMAQKDYAKAVDSYRESKRYMPDLDVILFKLGTAMIEAGKIKEAIGEFQEAVKLSPANSTIRYNLALAFLKDGNKKAAIGEFKKTVELDPKSELAGKARDYMNTLR